MAQWRRVRIYLEFPGIDIHCQKCWFLFDSDSCRLVSDLTYLISKRFGLKPHRNLLLLLDDFVLPSSESIHIIRDNDLIKIVSNELDDSKSTVHNTTQYDESNEVHAHGLLHKKGKRHKKLNMGIIPDTTEAKSSKFTTSVNSNTSTTSLNGNSSSTLVNGKTDHTTSVNSDTCTTPVNGNTSTTSVNSDTCTKSGNTCTTPVNSNTCTTTVNGGTHIRFESSGSEDDSLQNTSTIQKQIVSHQSSLLESCNFKYIPFNESPDPPKIGDKIRYKVLELSDTYTPNISHYKLGIIKSFCLSTQNLIIQLSDETVKLELQRRESHSVGKFSISQELCDDIETCIEINLSDMIEPSIVENC